MNTGIFTRTSLTGLTNVSDATKEVKMDKKNSVKVSLNYDAFNIMAANRNVNRGHVEQLKKAFEAYGNFLKVQPILVNENMEIVDGQHRFVASKELGQPIYYTVAPGLTVGDARQMNALQRGWHTDDYAKSFAASGDPSYRKYLSIKEQYGFNHSTLLVYINGGESKNLFKSFRAGEFSIENEGEARRRLDNLAEIAEVTPLAKNNQFARALLIVMRSPDYNQKRMVQKLRLAADGLSKLQGIEDNLRQIEAAYNWKQKGERVRLF